MLGLVQVLDAVLGVLRLVVFIIAAAALVIFTIDWLVRTRRLSPFGAVARFFRRVVDPLIVPIEHRVVRAGGLPSSAPWWALIAIVIGGLVVRDRSLPALRGRYVFGDFCDSRILAFRPRPGRVAARPTGLRIPNVSSFGESLRGTLFITSLDGGLYRVRQ